MQQSKFSQAHRTLMAGDVRGALALTKEIESLSSRFMMYEGIVDFITIGNGYAPHEIRRDGDAFYIVAGKYRGGTYKVMAASKRIPNIEALHEAVSTMIDQIS